jgi:nitrite reductase/ring-hydroxylating ferredoxin subunit
MKRSKLLLSIIGVVGVLIILGTVLTLAACSGGATAASTSNSKTSPPKVLPEINSDVASAATASSSNSKISPTWMTPEINGDAVSIPTDVVESKVNVHFEVKTEKRTAYFMSYVYGGKIYVRADYCPPCRSINFTLYKGTLVCNSCGTVFSATDGKGLQGACVNYPKASVPYETISGKMVMKQADLVTAFENTLQPGLP